MIAARILVVDDHPSILELASLVLEAGGYVVKTVTSAELALTALQSLRPDIILVDIQMPVMDGIELARILRLDPAHRWTKIVVMSADSETSILQRAQEAGCDGYIAKPFDPRTLAGLVGEYLNGRGWDAPGPAKDGASRENRLGELRNSFLIQGVEQCADALKRSRLGEGGLDALKSDVHQWVGLGGTLGLPEISNHARRLKVLLHQSPQPLLEIENALRTASLLFHAGAKAKAELDAELTAGLNGMRIGLVGFNSVETERIQTALDSSQAQTVLRELELKSIGGQIECDAIVVNTCHMPPQSAPIPPSTVPVVFISTRSSAGLLSNLNAGAADFLIAPWGVEEVLMRVYRVVASRVRVRSEPNSSSEPENPWRVLVVDDDPKIGAIVVGALRQINVDADFARSGRIALDSLRKSIPDAIVLDINMVGMDGFDVLTTLRHNVRTRHVPVLILTARQARDDVARGFASGANDYVVKPFRPSELAMRVKKMIEQSKAATPADTLYPVA